MALAFEAFTEFGKMRCNVARYSCCVQRGVEALGIGPDRAEQIVGFGIVQIVDTDPVAVAVRELVVALTLAREVGVKLYHMADIDNH